MKFLKEKKINIKSLSKMFDVKYRIMHLKDASGYADLSSDTIFIGKFFKKKVNKKQELDFFVSTVLHEICHILAKRKGKYSVYHSPTDFVSMYEYKVYKRTALKAELYVDKMAQKICKKLFPNVKYDKCYRTKEHRQFLKNHLDTIKYKQYKKVPIAFNLNIEGQ